jgi:tetratricopeptide (TPR) repeat protein
MSIRAARILLAGATCLLCLAACSTAPKPDDSTGSLSSQPRTDGGVTGILSDLWPSKKTASADADTTGAISTTTQPAEPGPSGEPVAPLSHPGLLGDDPNDDLQHGKRYFRANSFANAERSFRAAVEKHPRDAEAWVGLAASYDRLRRFDLADRAYQEAIRIVGRTPEVLNDQGFSYILRGDYGRAQRTLQEALTKDPGNPYIQANMHLLEESSRDGKAVQ